MPNIKSAKKRVKVNEKNAIRNRATKKMYKEAVKDFEAAASTDSKETQELYVKAVSSVDKAWSKGVLAKNTASRKKSALAKLLVK